MDFTFGMKSVLEGLFRVSKPSSFNDPMDCAGIVINERLPEVLIHDAVNRRTMRFYGDALLDEGMWGERFRKELACRDFIDRFYRIMSFRERNNGDEKEDRLFWSHYANHCNGIRVSLGLPEFPRHWQFRKVEYKGNIPVCHPSRISVLEHDPELMRFMRERIFTKDFAWCYEKEFRLAVELNGDFDCLEKIGDDYFVRWPYEQILGIDFGSRVLKAAAEQWTRICRVHPLLKHLKFRRAIDPIERGDFEYGYTYEEL